MIIGVVVANTGEDREPRVRCFLDMDEHRIARNKAMKNGVLVDSYELYPRFPPDIWAYALKSGLEFEFMIEQIIDAVMTR